VRTSGQPEDAGNSPSFIALRFPTIRIRPHEDGYGCRRNAVRDELPPFPSCLGNNASKTLTSVGNAMSSAS